MVHRQWYVGIGAYTSRLVWAEQKKMILFFYIIANPKHTITSTIWMYSFCFHGK